MDIKKWEDKIKEKRKQTPWRDFVRDIGSRRNITLYKYDNQISRYIPQDRFKNIIAYKKFDNERDNMLSFGIDIKIDQSFLNQLFKLSNIVPIPNLLRHGVNENVEFANETINSKNIYLSTLVIIDCENICYSSNVKENSNNVFNCNMVWNNSSNIYFGNGIIQSNSIFFSYYINDCYNIWFSSNLIGCQNCLFCKDLENQSYCISNKQYDKETFLLRKKSYSAKKINLQNDQIK